MDFLFVCLNKSSTTGKSNRWESSQNDVPSIKAQSDLRKSVFELKISGVHDGREGMVVAAGLRKNKLRVKLYTLKIQPHRHTSSSKTDAQKSHNLTKAPPAGDHKFIWMNLWGTFLIQITTMGV